MRLTEFIEKNTDAVIFDMDGTLIDSMGIWSDIDKTFLSKRGLFVPSDLQIQIEGKSFHETAVFFKERFSLPESLEEIKQIWHTMAYERYAHGMKMKEGAEAFLKMLCGRHQKTGIATSNSRELTECCLLDMGILSCFDAIVTANEVANGKPSPDIYRKTAEILGAEPSRCIVFEDTGAGIMAGNAAGMFTCAVFDEHNREKYLENCGIADFSISSFCDII